MVLSQADIRAEFREAALEPEASGYWDNEVAADDTIDPSDTAADQHPGDACTATSITSAT